MQEFYDLTDDRFALIISNTFDKKSSLKKHGEGYNDLCREGGENDVEKVDTLLKTLGFRVCVSRNIGSEVSQP